MKATYRYAIYGALFGCCFPLVATLLDVYVRGLPSSLQGIARAQADQPLHWIIDTAPVFLGLFAALGGRRQDQLAALNESLESLVRSRTASLERSNAELGREIAERNRIEAELRDATHRAEEANRAKSSFLATMSHEIRTPMYGMLGMLEILRGSDLDSARQKTLASARQSAESLMVILNDILDLSRIESGNVTLEHVPFDPGRLLQDVTSAFGPFAERKALTLACDHQWNAAEHALLGDPHRLRQVLGNLVSNAIKFTDRGGVRIIMHEQRRDGDRVQLQFVVSDTGIGMDRQAQSLIFDRFTQADATMTRRFGGTGLGLAIVAQLVQMMEGSIDVSSEAGAGSEFRITLWLPLTDPLADQVPESDATRDAAPLRPARILVAEDNEINQEIVRTLLEDAGQQVELVANGALAVAAARTQPDIILMDCQMPEMDGYEATRHIRAEGFADIPIIALTANAFAEDRDRCLASGMNDFLSKPFTQEQLVAVLRRWI